jgi:transcriptional regulator with XRE-family HTH domain
MPRVHLPQDFGFSTLTCGATESLADALRAELALRNWTDRDLARRVGVAHSTLGNYLRGERPFPAEVLTAVLDALLAAGPFRVPGLAEVTVIPILGNPESDILPGSPRVDTVTVLIDVPIEDQPRAAAWLQHFGRPATSTRARRRARGRWHKRAFAEGGIVAHRQVGKKPRGWLLVEFRAFDDAELNGFETIKNLLSSAACMMGDRMHVARLDLAVDYPVHPTWLLLRQPKVRNHELLVNRRGEGSIALGSRDSRWYLRWYDAAAKHGLPGPLTRLEVELKPDAPWTAKEVARLSDNPFSELYLGVLTAPDLTDEEVVQLQLARMLGVGARLKVLGRGRAVLDRAMAKAARAARLSPGADLSRVWDMVLELLALLFVVR